MALTPKQVEGITDMFVASFVNDSNELERKKILIEFEDVFGKSISDWKSICREKIQQRTSDISVIECYDSFINRAEQQDDVDIYQIRLLEENDLEQVRELINFTFGMGLTFYEDERLKKFIESGYSIVAYNNEEIVGVALAFEMPDYNTKTIYLDTFAVAENMRDCGIGKKMLQYIKSLAKSGRVGKIKLQTDRKIDAYHIYKHWGFQEDELIHMHCYFI